MQTTYQPLVPLYPNTTVPNTMLGFNSQASASMNLFDQIKEKLLEKVNLITQTQQAHITPHTKHISHTHTLSNNSENIKYQNHFVLSLERVVIKSCCSRCVLIVLATISIISQLSGSSLTHYRYTMESFLSAGLEMSVQVDLSKDTH